MARILLDTTVLIDALRGRPAARRLVSLRRTGTEPWACVISVEEIWRGLLPGEFIALDAETGETVWEFQTGSSVNATAITYTRDGRQQITVASGLGGSLANRYARGQVPTGGSLWTFALLPE